MTDIKRRIPQSVQRLAKLASLASLPTLHAEKEVLDEITPLLSSFGASPEFVAPNVDNTGYYILFDKKVHFVQIQKKWELGSMENSPVHHEVPLVVYKEPVENIVAFVTSSIDEDFVYLVHKDHMSARSLSDMETRWLRFQNSEHVDEFIGHCLAMSAPKLLSKAKMLMFHSGSSSFAGSMSASEAAAETERLTAESERTLVVTDLVVKSVSDILTRVKEEVVSAMKKSQDFSARWGTKYNKIAQLNITMKDQQSKRFDDGNAPCGVKTCEYDFQRVAQNADVCARIKGLGGSKILFSCEAHLSDNTHEMAIITDKSLRIEKLRKNREVHVIPFNAIEEIQHETPTDVTSKENAPKVLIKVDFSICTKVRGDLMLRFPTGANGLRQKNLFLVAMTSAYEAAVVTHLTITETKDVFWARRGTLESQLVRMMRAIRPDEENPRTQTVTAANANPKMIMNARLALYLCLKQPHRVISSLSACSSGVDRSLLTFLARTMHRIFLAHQEAVAQDHELHGGKHDDEYKNHGDLRCIPFVQPCVDYEVSSYRFHRHRLNEARAKHFSTLVQNQNNNNSFNSASFTSNTTSNQFNNNNDDFDKNNNDDDNDNDNNGNRLRANTTGTFTEEFYSKSTADNTLLAPPSFGSSDCFASLALREYIGTAGASFVSLCVGRPMEDFSSNPETLQLMTLQSKQHWASQFLRHLRGIVLGDGVDEVLPGSFKVIVALIWQNFERERGRTCGGDNNTPNGDGDGNGRRTSNVLSHFMNHTGGENNNNIMNTFDEVTVVGGFLFNQFLRPALKDPLNEGLISDELSEFQKKNLEDVTILIECVLTQSDLPLATRQKDFSEGQRTFLRRFVDNEVQDAHRMLKSLIYPEISNDDPEDDGSAVPDYFPPPVPGELSFGSVELLPFGDPRTVEAFWNKYVLKMPIDLHNLKLLQAFTLAMKSVSMQALTAAFTPQLHEHGMDLSSSASNAGMIQQQQQQSSNHHSNPMVQFSSSVNQFSSGMMKSSNSNMNNFMNDDEEDDSTPGYSPPSSPRILGSSITFKLGASSSSNMMNSGSPTMMNNTRIGGNSNSNNTNFASSSTGSPTTTSGAASTGGGRAGRMRSSTLIRAESTAAERSAIAERTIHRLTLEVKNLKEQLAQARQAELETRMAAARAMESFSHSFAMQMTRTSQAAQRAQNKAKNSKNSGKKRRGSSGKRRRNSAADASSTASSSSGDSDSSSDSDYSDDVMSAQDNRNDSFNNTMMGNASFASTTNNTRKLSNPFTSMENKTGVNMSSVLSTEARWRHALEHLPAASRSTKGAGRETVFGCPMDAQCLAFLALPMTQSSHPQQARSPASAFPPSLSSQQQQQQKTYNNNHHHSDPQFNSLGTSGRTSPWNQQQQQQQQSSNPLDFNNFSFINK